MSPSPNESVDKPFAASRKASCSSGPAALLIAVAMAPWESLRSDPTEQTNTSAFNH